MQVRRSVIALIVCVAALVPGVARAQAQMTYTEDSGYIQAHIGFQPTSHDIEQIALLPIYDEESRIENRLDAAAGVLFDIGGGFRVWDQWFVGGAITLTSGDSDGAVTGNIAHPLVADQFRQADTTVSGAEHSEVAVHFFGLWRMPVNETFEVGFFFGPSMVSVKQDLISSVGVTETGPPYATVEFAAVELEEYSDTVFGFNIGADVTYNLTERLAASGFVRFTQASADLETPGGTVEVDAGGFQLGVGAKVRF